MEPSWSATTYGEATVELHTGQKNCNHQGIDDGEPVHLDFDVTHLEVDVPPGRPAYVGLPPMNGIGEKQFGASDGVHLLSWGALGKVAHVAVELELVGGDTLRGYLEANHTISPP